MTKVKYQNFKSTEGFSYKIWTKNSEEPIVYLHNWPLPRAKSLFENTMENPFFYFFKYWPKRSKNFFRIELWTFSFKICFQNQFLTLGGQTENTQVRIFAYFQFDHFRKSKLIPKADLKWQCPYFCSKKMDFPSFFFFKKWSCSGRGQLWR